MADVDALGGSVCGCDGVGWVVAVQKGVPVGGPVVWVVVGTERVGVE